jgi:hypothetical protein
LTIHAAISFSSSKWPKEGKSSNINRVVSHVRYERAFAQGEIKVADLGLNKVRYSSSTTTARNAAKSPARGRALRRSVPFVAVATGLSAATGMRHRRRRARRGHLRMRVRRRTVADLRLRDVRHSHASRQERLNYN